MTDELLSQIRTAVADGADDLTKQRGVNACRNLLAVLGSKPGEPLQAATPAPVASPISTAMQAMAAAPPAAVLDAVIAKLESRLPAVEVNAEPEAQPVMLRIPFIPIPSLKGG